MEEMTSRVDKSLPFAAFCIGIGISVAMNALLGSLGVFTMEFGQSSFLWLNVAVYGPSFPVAAAMALASDSEAQSCPTEKMLWCDARRVILAFATMAILLTQIPAHDQSLSMLLLFAVVIGLMGAIAMGYSFQMIVRAGARRKSGSCEAGLSFGYQASSLVCFLVQKLCGFEAGRSGLQVAQQRYFDWLALVAAAAILSVVFFARFALAQRQVVDASSPLIEAEAEEENQNGECAEGVEALSWKEAWKVSRRGVVGLFLTIFSSIVVFPFYSFVPSQDTSSKEASARFATTLFFVKAFSDTLSRPITVLLPRLIRTRKVLFVVSLLRMVFCVPLFFLYTFGKSLPRSDICFAAFVGAFSASSGYLMTTSYQLAPTEGRSSFCVRRITTVMNLSFQLAIFTALLISLSIRFAFISE